MTNGKPNAHSEKGRVLDNSPAMPFDDSLLAYLETLSLEERLRLNDSAANAAVELRAAFDTNADPRAIPQTTVMSLTDLIKALLEAEVKFVLAGGLAAVAQGAPVTTFDADIVHDRDEANGDRLLQVLHEVHAYVREPTQRGQKPSRADLIGAAHNLFVTDHGLLGCLSAIEDGLDYEALQPMSVDVGFHGHTLRVVELRALAGLKSRRSNHESRLLAAILHRAAERQ